MDEKLTYTLPELQELKIELELKLKSVQEARNLLKAAADSMKGIMMDPGSVSTKWRFSVNQSLIRNIKGITITLPHEQPSENNIKWKDLVLQVIIRYDMPLNSQLLYQKFRQEMPNYNKDRRFIIKNISAALTVLYNEGKLFRHSFKGKNEYLYGVIDFYDSRGKLKEEYFSKFKQEYEGI